MFDMHIDGFNNISSNYSIFVLEIQIVAVQHIIDVFRQRFNIA